MNEQHYGPKNPFSQELHATKYRTKGESFHEAMCRIAAELSRNDEERQTYKDILLTQRFLPAGRIQAAVGAARQVTAMNCYASSVIEDNSDSIFEVVKEAFMTMRVGGGIGFDFSRLRPEGYRISTLESSSSGPLSFMDIFDAVCATVMGAGHRRGAMLATLSISHPDIEEFIRAKQNETRFRNFNVSVGVTDKFMQALEAGEDFPLEFDGKVDRWVSARGLWDEIMRSTYDWAEPGVLFIDRINKMNNLHWLEDIRVTNPCFTGDMEVWTSEGPKTFKELEGTTVKVLTETDDHKLVLRSMDVFKTGVDKSLIEVTLDDGTIIECTPEHEFFDINRNKVEAKDLTEGARLASVYRHKVISVKLIDKVADVYCGTVEETHRFFLSCDRGAILVSNCGEVPLQPNGACLLGSFNLTKYLAGGEQGVPYQFDYEGLKKDIPSVVKMIDSVIDTTTYPLESQKVEATTKRRMGLGITGLANTAEILGTPYGSPEMIDFTKSVLEVIRDEAYRASISLAKERGPFEAFDRDQYLAGNFVQTLPEDIKKGIWEHGIRNSHLTSIAPTGTISLTADNISSGLEPVFSLQTQRIVNMPSGPQNVLLKDYAYNYYGVKGKTSEEVTTQEHVEVLKATVPFIDSAVSKTCNIGSEVSWEEFKGVYLQAYEAGAKGITTFRPAGKRFGILTASPEESSEGAACFIDPETGSKTCE